MRKLIGALLAATMLMPTMASAQEPDYRRGDRQRGAQAPDAAPGRDDVYRGGYQGGPRAERQERAERPERAEQPERRERAERPDQPRPDTPRTTDRRPDRATFEGNRDRRDDGRRDGGRDGQQVRRDDDRRFDQRPDPRRDDRPNVRYDNDRNQGDNRRYGGTRGGTWGGNRGDSRATWSNDRQGGWNDDRRSGWNRGWRNDDRYDWNRYRTGNRGAYRLPRYYSPGGGSYRRFGVGAGLSSVFWNRNYWIADPWTYRLPEAYGPYRWVRYYDDALLVDLRSGQVIDAVYGIFW